MTNYLSVVSELIHGFRGMEVGDGVRVVLGIKRNTFFSVDSEKIYV